MDQRDFTTALLDPDRPTPAGMVDPEGRPAGKRFDVYRNNVAASLTDALETGFPALVKLLGRDYFRSLAGLFLRAHPPRSRILSQYGAEMPAFLAAFAPLAKYPYLADVARLELALRRSYHAADAAPLETDGLDPAALMALRPRLAPASIVLSSPHPILGIWRHNMDPTPRAPRRAPRRADHPPRIRPGAAPPARRWPCPGRGARRAHHAWRGAGTRSSGAPGMDVSVVLGLMLSTGALTLSDTGDTP